MKALTISVLGVAALSVLIGATAKNETAADPAAAKGLQWLVSVQGQDGGWGQDGGSTSNVRQGMQPMRSGNDVANSAVALLALAHSGHTPAKGAYSSNSRRGLDFILKHVERSPDDGLAITDVKGTQIQHKLGPYIDTFLTSMLLSELDGTIPDKQLAARVRQSLQKCVTKIQKHQLQDGSWNISGGWAPVLGTSMASRSLDLAKKKGVEVDQKTMARVDTYTKNNVAYATAQPGTGRGVVGGVPGGMAGGVVGGIISAPLSGSAPPPAPLYQAAQALEQMTRSERGRKENAQEIKAVSGQLADAAYVRGFGSMGGEEFFSYLNISDSLRRAGGKQWTDWNTKIKTQLVSLQNEDGTWAGHHCITGRVAVTSAAVLTLTADRQQ